MASIRGRCATGATATKAPRFRLGRHVVYRRAAIEKWISAQEAASSRGGVA